MSAQVRDLSFYQLQENDGDENDVLNASDGYVRDFPLRHNQNPITSERIDECVSAETGSRLFFYFPIEVFNPHPCCLDSIRAGKQYEHHRRMLTLLCHLVGSYQNEPPDRYSGKYPVVIYMEFVTHERVHPDAPLTHVNQLAGVTIVVCYNHILHHPGTEIVNLFTNSAARTGYESSTLRAQKIARTRNSYSIGASDEIAGRKVASDALSELARLSRNDYMEMVKAYTRDPLPAGIAVDTTIIDTKNPLNPFLAFHLKSMITNRVLQKNTRPSLPFMNPMGYARGRQLAFPVPHRVWQLSASDFPFLVQSFRFPFLMQTEQIRVMFDRLTSHGNYDEVAVQMAQIERQQRAENVNRTQQHVDMIHRWEMALSSGNADPATLTALSEAMLSAAPPLDPTRYRAKTISEKVGIDIESVPVTLKSFIDVRKKVELILRLALATDVNTHPSHTIGYRVIIDRYQGQNLQLPGVKRAFRQEMDELERQTKRLILQPAIDEAMELIWSTLTPEFPHAAAIKSICDLMHNQIRLNGHLSPNRGWRQYDDLSWNDSAYVTMAQLLEHGVMCTTHHYIILSNWAMCWDAFDLTSIMNQNCIHGGPHQQGKSYILDRVAEMLPNNTQSVSARTIASMIANVSYDGQIWQQHEAMEAQTGVAAGASKRRAEMADNDGPNIMKMICTEKRIEKIMTDTSGKKREIRALKASCQMVQTTNMNNYDLPVMMKSRYIFRLIRIRKRYDVSAEVRATLDTRDQPMHHVAANTFRLIAILVFLMKTYAHCMPQLFSVNTMMAGVILRVFLEALVARGGSKQSSRSVARITRLAMSYAQMEAALRATDPDELRAFKSKHLLSVDQMMEQTLRFNCRPPTFPGAEEVFDETHLMMSGEALEMAAALEQTVGAFTPDMLQDALPALYVTENSLYRAIFTHRDDMEYETDYMLIRAFMEMPDVRLDADGVYYTYHGKRQDMWKQLKLAWRRLHSDISDEVIYISSARLKTSNIPSKRDTATGAQIREWNSKLRGAVDDAIVRVKTLLKTRPFTYDISSFPEVDREVLDGTFESEEVANAMRSSENVTAITRAVELWRISLFDYARKVSQQPYISHQSDRMDVEGDASNDSVASTTERFCFTTPLPVLYPVIYRMEPRPCLITSPEDTKLLATLVENKHRSRVVDAIRDTFHATTEPGRVIIGEYGGAVDVQKHDMDFVTYNTPWKSKFIVKMPNTSKRLLIGPGHRKKRGASSVSSPTDPDTARAEEEAAQYNHADSFMNEMNEDAERAEEEMQAATDEMMAEAGDEYNAETARMMQRPSTVPPTTSEDTGAGVGGAMVSISGTHAGALISSTSHHYHDNSGPNHLSSTSSDPHFARDYVNAYGTAVERAMHRNIADEPIMPEEYLSIPMDDMSLRLRCAQLNIECTEEVRQRYIPRLHTENMRYYMTERMRDLTHLKGKQRNRIAYINRYIERRITTADSIHPGVLAQLRSYIADLSQCIREIDTELHRCNITPYAMIRDREIGPTLASSASANQTQGRITVGGDTTPSTAVTTRQARTDTPSSQSTGSVSGGSEGQTPLFPLHRLMEH